MKTNFVFIGLVALVLIIGFNQIRTYKNLVEGDTVHVSHEFEIIPKKGTTHLEIYPKIKARYTNKANFGFLTKLEFEPPKIWIPVTSTEPIKITVESNIPSIAIWKAEAFVYFWDKSTSNKEHTIGYVDHRTVWYHLSKKEGSQ